MFILTHNWFIIIFKWINYPFLIFLVLICNKVNVNKCKSHKEKVLGPPALKKILTQRYVFKFIFRERGKEAGMGERWNPQSFGVWDDALTN